MGCHCWNPSTKGHGCRGSSCRACVVLGLDTLEEKCQMESGKQG